MNSDEETVFRKALEQGAGEIGVPLSVQQVDQCARYTALLLETNQHTNLTRITQPAEVAVKHFVDSLAVFRAVADLKPGATIADVGTGAGFPGMVLKIVRPDLRVTLLDSLGKRLTFLGEVAAALGLDDVALVHARAEEAGRDPAHRDQYDLVAARAVANLPTLLEWCAPLCAVRARFIALKAAGVDEELAVSERAMSELGVRLETDLALTLPFIAHHSATENAEPAALRRLLVFRKSFPTRARYPRRTPEIKANPL